MDTLAREFRNWGFAGSMLWMVGVAVGQEATVVGRSHARGITTVRISCAGRVGADDVLLSWSRDGLTFEDPRIGLPNDFGLIASAAYEPERTIIAVPLVAHAGSGPGAFLFDAPGQYFLRWSLGSDRPSGARRVVQQTITVGPVHMSDQGFIRRVGDTEFVDLLFGKEMFGELPKSNRDIVRSAEWADLRSLMIIGELLKATRAMEIGSAIHGRNSLEELERWADSLWALARELPESSYAPYAAYYAACSRAIVPLNRIIEQVRAERRAGTVEGREQERRRWAELSSQDAEIAVAKEAFAFAAQRGDAYLKPRALYQQAWVAGFLGHREEMNTLLDQAAEAAPGEGTIHDWVTKLRADK